MNSKEKKLFSKLGYFIREKVISTNECKKISQLLMKAISKEKRLHQKYKSKNSKMKDYGMVMVCPMYGNIFLKLLQNKKLIDPFNKILGKDCIIYAYTSSSMPPNKGNFSNRIHVDCPRFIKNYITNMGCTIALDDFYLENGATQFMPGSHLSPKTPTISTFKKKRKHFVCKKGSVFFFNGRIFHSGGKNSTNSWRHGLTLNVSRYWMKQRFDMRSILKNKIKIKNLDPKIKQKLGFTTIPPSSLEEYYGYGMKKSYSK